MENILITGGVGLFTTIVSSVTTWILARKKYNSEVDNNLIANMQQSLEFYKTLSDDNKERLEEALERDARLEKEVDELKRQMLNLMGSICVDLSCQLRKRDLTLFAHGITVGKEVQEE